RLLDEELPAAERSAIETHVQVCTSCQFSLESLLKQSGLSLSGMDAQQIESDATPGLLKVGVPDSGKTRASLPAAPRLPSIRGYEMLVQLGAGGMGVVYKARQTKLNREVALKVMRASAGANARDLARFRVEAEAVARLQHPNIVQVFDSGDADGQPYLCLE